MLRPRNYITTCLLGGFQYRKSIMTRVIQLSDYGLPFIALVVVTLASFGFLHYFFSTHHKNTLARKNVPPGSLGLPLIGESWSFVKAGRQDRGGEWIQKRVSAYGPVFKTSLMGSPTVVITGQIGNKFIFSAKDDVLSVQQPPWIVRLSGKSNIFELTGARYKLVKVAIMNFLKPERLQEYIGQMDSLVKIHLVNEMKGNDIILAVQFMKKLMFNVTCSLLFGLHDEAIKATLFEDFSQLFKGLWSIPINLPGTAYWRALRGRKRIERMVQLILLVRKEHLIEGIVSDKDDIVSCLLALRDENGVPITEEEVVDNFVTLIIASHETSAILLSLMVWKLAQDPKIYQKVLEEQTSIVREKEPHRTLAWSDVQKMKYTWRVAQELMRVIPPVFGSFRKALEDVSFGGYDIPKGWQVFWEASGTHMDKDIFEDPTTFDPSRFENPSKPIPAFTYIPFGAGSRMCMGNEFARVEALTVMHHLVTNFEWSQLFPNEKITRRPMPYPCKGLPIKLKPRNLSEFI